MMRSHKRKGLKHYLRKVFHRRNIIVMSDDSVDHFPISAKAQLLTLFLVVGGFCWISYSTGSYVAAHKVLEEKDRQLVFSALQKKKIGEEYSLLKHDLEKLREVKGDMNEYARFVLQQHGTAEASDPELAALPDDEARLGKIKSRLMDRITFLEERLAELQQENEYIVTAVTERTQNKIKELRDIIKMTGLETSALSKQAKRELARTQDAYENQGGPYIPATVKELAPDMMQNLDELMALQHVVQKLPLGRPMNTMKLTSHFGQRYDPFTHRPAMHSGQDFVGAPGARVVATADGVVKSADWRGAYGQMIEIDHGFGVTTRYAHLSKIAVHPGQKIKKGQMLGNQGSTGRSTGAHLHYEVRYHDNAINPMRFIRAGKNVD